MRTLIYNHSFGIAAIGVVGKSRVIYQLTLSFSFNFAECFNFKDKMKRYFAQLIEIKLCFNVHRVLWNNTIKTLPQKIFHHLTRLEEL